MASMSGAVCESWMLLYTCRLGFGSYIGTYYLFLFLKGLLSWVYSLITHKVFNILMPFIILVVFLASWLVDVYVQR